jgi:hypothetical protein
MQRCAVVFALDKRGKIWVGGSLEWRLESVTDLLFRLQDTASKCFVVNGGVFLGR